MKRQECKTDVVFTHNVQIDGMIRDSSFGRIEHDLIVFFLPFEYGLRYCDERVLGFVRLLTLRVTKPGFGDGEVAVARVMHFCNFGIQLEASTVESISDQFADQPARASLVVLRELFPAKYFKGVFRKCGPADFFGWDRILLLQVGVANRLVERISRCVRSARTSSDQHDADFFSMDAD